MELTKRKRYNLPWIPHPKNKPQYMAYINEADELLYGFAAGAGKSDLMLGLAFTDHFKSIIFRREFPQFRELINRSIEIMKSDELYNRSEKTWKLPDGRVIEFGAVEREGDVRKYQGRPHDLICFDELTQFTFMQYITLIGWLRTENPAQRCRIVSGTNPPLGDEADHIGLWVFDYWAPWLKVDYPNPAEPGELRWFVMIDNESFETKGKDDHPLHKGERLEPMSRTYIPGRVTDNPYYAETEYHKRLSNLPEPLRSKLLHGDASVVQQDNPWQVIPSEWVDIAMARWRETQKPVTLCEQVGIDVARGGLDNTVICKRYGNWFDELIVLPGVSTPDGASVTREVLKTIGDASPDICVDADGVGGSVVDTLDAYGMDVRAIHSGGKSVAMDKHNKFGFLNLRAELWWKFREMLDPEHGEEIALPPDRKLKQELITPTYKTSVRGIQIEAKDEIKKRLGRSPDRAEAVIYATLNKQVGFHVFD